MLSIILGSLCLLLFLSVVLLCMVIDRLNKKIDSYEGFFRNAARHAAAPDKVETGPKRWSFSADGIHEEGLD